MFIEEIVIEGFKSYATRTVISGWDAEFNSITGLNGTGKSNILDAICFVLGIDNLKQVRATSLHDLVYKRGQAGITKASVTIVFNNANAAASPIGYAECPQITVTRQIILNGKNKYLINGHNAQQKAIENLFQSVQLNVNNPHFLIMQGQITRVLNMKPPEILAMIEESAGTRMFEDRKSKAISTMEKKEKKVDEIAELLLRTIEPKLDALRSERSDFIEYKRTEADMERLERLSTAFKYAKAERAQQKAQRAVEEAQQRLAAIQEEGDEARRAAQGVSEEIATVAARRQREAAGSDKVRQLEEACREAANEMVRLQAQIDNANESIGSEEEAIRVGTRRIADETAKMAKVEHDAEQSQAKYEEGAAKRRELAGEIERTESLLRSLQTGLSSSSDGQLETGYAALLREARDTISSATTALAQAEKRAAAIRREVAIIEPKCKESSKGSSLLAEKVAVLKGRVTAIEAQAVEGSSEAVSKKAKALLEGLLQEKASLQASLAVEEGEADRLRSIVSSVDFRYSRPDAHFDDAKVRGVVAKLVRLEDASLPYAPALQVTAGGRLYNVVVDDEATAAALLEKGRLARRVTIIPLNKIQSRPIPRDRARLAAELTKGAAKVGLSLVSFDGSVAAAMDFVFGSTFVCDTKDAANMVAFDRRLGHRAVTLEGDVYEPSGTLSGGSAPSSGDILTKLHAFQRHMESAAGITARLAGVEANILACEEERRGATRLKNDLRAAQQELSAVERQFELDDAGQMLARHAALTDELVLLEEAICKHQATIASAQASCSAYERDCGDLARDRDGKLDELAASLAAMKAKHAKGEAAFKRFEAAHNALKSSLLAIEANVKEGTGQVEACRAKIASTEDALSELNEAHLAAMTRHGGLQIRLDSEIGHLRQFDNETRRLEGLLCTLRETIEATDEARERASRSLSGAGDQLRQADASLEQMKRANGWIDDHCATFGVPGGPFDFAQVSLGEVEKRLKAMRAHAADLERSINFNVMDMIDRVEAKDASLRQMLLTVKRDRAKIDGTISTLNEYMLEALQKTWAKVNEDFGQIFGHLLAGSNARLDLVEGGSITDGLEIKVSLGGVWKESLAELSGGQRSLVALSLILALLQFKPAPMYILDEVDAALDLSHTENIGALLRTRFKGSQFIVVSLKEGMFANANVVFRTRFRDGVSGVDRIVNRVGSVAALPSKKVAIRTGGGRHAVLSAPPVGGASE